jgi:flagellin
MTSLLVANTNVTSLIAQHRLSQNQNTLTTSMARLSSGYRINRAADDAAGLSLSNNLVSQIRRMQQASRNIQDGTSALDTADGALGVINDTLQRVRELSIQAGNDTNDATTRSSISTEIRLLMKGVDQIAASTQINGTNLLNGSATKALLQVGPSSDAVTSGLDVSSAFTDATSTGLGALGASPKTFPDIDSIDLSSNAIARTFSQDIDAAIAAVGMQRSQIGAYQNRLESTGSNLDSSITNASASNSRIRDVDVAAESATMAQSQVLTQAATMILSQTNDLPKMILTLLQK